MKTAITCLLFVFTTLSSFGQIHSNSFTGVRWKIKEFYVNKFPVRNAKLDSIRFFFSENGMLRLGIASGTNAPSVPYTYHAKDSVITIDDKRFSELRYKVLFFDRTNLVITQDAPADQKQITSIEYRMVPDL